MTSLETSKSKRKAANGEDAPEKKERPAVYCPDVFCGSNPRIAFTSNLPARYKVPENPDRIEFCECLNPVGPDSLTIFPNKSDPKSKPVWLTVHRKTDGENAHRVVFARKGTEPVEMQGVTEGSVFRITGPGGFDLRLVCESTQKEQDPRLIAIAKERELIAKVLLIRKEYEETVLPHLPDSIQFTGAMVLGSLLPSGTVELRKGQLEDAEKQLASQ